MIIYRYIALGTWFNWSHIVHHMLSQVVKPSAYPNPMPTQNKWSPSATIYKCYLSSCGDLLDIFGGLQTFELKLDMEDHKLTKVYF
jgi:hypothetical protein